MGSQSDDVMELEHGKDYKYICKSCDKIYPCGCGNPYPRVNLADHITVIN